MYNLITKGNTTFSTNDILRIKDGIYDEWMRVSSVISPTSYAVVRDLAGSYPPGNNPTWKKGAAVLNYRQSGNGGVYMTASETSAPYLSVFTHAGSPWTTITQRARLGNLSGINDPVHGSLSGYGLWTDNIYLTGAVNATSGRISGAFSVLGALTVGTGGSLGSGQTAYDTGTGWWWEYNGGTPRMSLGNSAGNKLTWNGSVLAVVGNITATSGTIGGWTINSTQIYSGAGAATCGLDSTLTAGDDARFFAGSATPSTAPFRVTESGALFAANATLFGYRQYDAIATNDGVAGATLVYYNGTTYASIKATIDAAIAGGATKISIFVRRGTYNEDKNCNSYFFAGWAIDVTIVGEDKNQTSIIMNSTHWGWKFDRRVNISNITFSTSITGSGVYGPIVHDSLTYPYVVIDNCIIKNTDTAVSSSGWLIMLYRGATGEYRITNNQFYFSSSSFTGSASGAIMLLGAQDNVLVQNNIFQTSNGGYYYGSSSSIRVTISGNTIGVIGHATNFIPAGIHLSGSEIESRVENNKIYNFSGVGKYTDGIYWLGSTSVVQKNKIINNTISGAANGINVQGLAMTVSNNTISDCTVMGINAIGGHWNTNDAMGITGNIITNCTASGEGGIRITRSNFLIQGNVIFNCDSAIYDTDNQVAKITVTGNIIRKCKYGINIRGVSLDYGPNDSIMYTNNLIIGDQSSGSASYGTHAIVCGTFINDLVISNNVIQYYNNGIVNNPRNATSTGNNWSISNNNLTYLGSGYAIDFYTYASSTSSFNLINNSLDIRCLFNGCGGAITDNRTQNTLRFNSSFSGSISNNNLNASSGHVLHFNTSISYAQIANNVIRNSNTYRAIHVGTTGYACTISNNTFLGSFGHEQIYFGGDSEDMTITGNVFQGADNYYMIYFAANMDYSTGNEFKGSIISNNAFFNRYTGSIYVAGHCYNNVWNGNRMSNMNSSYCVVIAGTAHKCIFSSNRVSNALLAGTADGWSIGTNDSCLFANNLRT